jgi:hypothetical protein
VIIAVPLQETDWVYPMGGVGPVKPRYLYTWTWWRWYCTDCRVMSDPANRWSWLTGALDRGEYHEELAQCQRVGQLELFAVGGAR